MDNKLLLDVLKEIKTDVRQISIDQSEINGTLAKQEAQLAEHIRRTALLEAKMSPVEKHVSMINGGLKVLGAITIILAAFEFISKRF